MANSGPNRLRYLMFKWSRPWRSVDRDQTNMMDRFVELGKLALRISFEDHIRKARGKAIAMTALADGTPAKGRTRVYTNVGCENA